MAALPIVIVGAGPAGATLALLLCSHGTPAILVDAGRQFRSRLELVAPRTAAVFLAAGLGNILEDPRLSQPCHGIRRTWQGVESEDDFIGQPLGYGRSVDRALLDAALLRRAVQAGTRIVRCRAVHATEREGQISVALSDGSSLDASFAVDATGRAATLARSLGARRFVSARLVADLEAGNGGAVADRRLTVIGSEAGWRYSLAGPGGRFEQWRVAPPSRHRGSGELRVDASPARLDVFSGTRWLAIGDAALSFDPVASQGLGHAVSGAMTAAGKLLSGDRMTEDDADAFALFNLQTWSAHRRARQETYRRSPSLNAVAPAPSWAAR